MSLKSLSRAKRYVLYVRKSMGAEERQMASIPDQIAEMKKRAKKLGLNIVYVIEEAMSAKEPGRPEFNRMVKLIKKGKADGIIVWKLNRLARNPIDGAEITWLLQKENLKHIVTYTGEHFPQDNILMLNIHFGMATDFVKELSVDVKRGQYHKALNGWYPSQVPIGYLHRSPKKYPSATKQIIVDPKSFYLVKDLWMKLIDGTHSIAELMDLAHLKGLRNRKGTQFTTGGFYKIFENEFYSGYFTITDLEGKTKRIKGKHTPMITPAQFKLVRARLEKHQLPRVNNPENCPFSGLFICVCGHSIVKEEKRRVACTRCPHVYSARKSMDCPECSMKFNDMINARVFEITYFRCRNQKNCRFPSISSVDLEKKVQEELKKLSISPFFFEMATESLRLVHEKKIINTADEVRTVEGRVEALMEKKKKFEEYAFNVDMDKESYQSGSNEIMKELAALEESLETMQTEGNTILAKDEKRLAAALNIHQNYMKRLDAGKRKILKPILSKPRLAGKTVVFTTYPVLQSVSEAISVVKKKFPTVEPPDSLKNMAQNAENEHYDKAIQLMCGSVEKHRNMLPKKPSNS